MWNVETFFSLTSYAHQALWENNSLVWNALQHIPDYLSSKHLGVIEIEIPEGVYLKDPHLISIGKETLIEPGAYIKGPCIIGNRCTIGHSSYLRGNIITGDGCIIGHATEIKNTILLNEAKAPHFNYVGDSILGNRVNLGAGVKCANLRFDKSPIRIHIEGKKIETGLHKLGAILGDDVHIGCNAVTSPGTLIEKGACIPPCTHVKGVVKKQL